MSEESAAESIQGVLTEFETGAITLDDLLISIEAILTRIVDTKAHERRVREIVNRLEVIRFGVREENQRRLVIDTLSNAVGEISDGQ